MNLNDKNLNALSYKVKALIALERYNDALTCIKEALSIKYNKTLYKYLIDIENKINFNKREKSEEKQKFLLENDNNKKICHKQEYKKIFINTNNSLFYLNGNDNDIKSECYSDNSEDIRELKDKRNHEIKLSSLSYYQKMLFKFISLFFKIIIRHFLRHKYIYSIIATLISIYKRREVIKIISFLINFLGRLIVQ